MKSIVAAQKCKKYMVSGNIEGFFISCSTEIKKKRILSTLLHPQDHTEENARIGGSGELLLSSNDLKYFSKESFTMKA